MAVVAVDESFADLMGRLRSGEDEAAREVFGRFARRLVGLARGHLDLRITRKVDPEEVVQSAYKSFFARQRDGRLEVGSWDGLWGLLTHITLRKCADRAQHYKAARRDVNREQAGPAGGAEDTPPPLWALAVDREPEPFEAAILAETVEALFRDAYDEDEKAVLELSLQGCSSAEISAKLGRAERSVRRMRERIRTRLERMRGDG
jgi:RNA polymerase sigma-70 factor (ECF subfamily)